MKESEGENKMAVEWKGSKNSGVKGEKGENQQCPAWKDIW